MPKKKRSSMGMSRTAVQGVFNDVFTSDVSSSHYVSHGDASRRETAAFGPDVHAPPPPGLDRSSLHRGGDTVADTLTNIEMSAVRDNQAVGRAEALVGAQLEYSRSTNLN